MRAAAATVAALMVSLVVAVSILGGVIGSGSARATGAVAAVELAAQTSCTFGGVVTGLSAEQSSDAEAIVSSASALSAENHLAARIALMTAYDESNLVNLGAAPGNAGSIGLFQQRVSQGWGTVAQEEDPTDATAMFVQHLLALPGWSATPPWVAAQAVQRSADPSGSNYQRYWALSGQLLDAVTGVADTPGSCGQGVPGGEPGPTSRHGLPVGYRIPAGTSPQAALAVSYAIAQLGKPYIWAAAGPNAFDCSGLTMAAWAQAGVTLDHYTVDQMHEGVQIPAGHITAGDLVLVPGSDAPGPGLPGHVGIYLGYGLVESAVDPLQGIIVQSWQAFTSGGLDAVVDPV